jgi:hypothetical protein
VVAEVRDPSFALRSMRIALHFVCRIFCSQSRSGYFERARRMIFVEVRARVRFERAGGAKVGAMGGGWRSAAHGDSIGSSPRLPVPFAASLDGSRRFLGVRNRHRVT